MSISPDFIFSLIVIKRTFSWYGLVIVNIVNVIKQIFYVSCSKRIQVLVVMIFIFSILSKVRANSIRHACILSFCAFVGLFLFSILYSFILTMFFSFFVPILSNLVSIILMLFILAFISSSVLLLLMYFT